MSRVLHNFPKHFQWPPMAPGGSMQHERDMRAAISCPLAYRREPAAAFGGNDHQDWRVSAIVGNYGVRL
jgi:hypothetical protein